MSQVRRDWYRKNAEKVKKQVKAWRNANSAQVRVASRERYMRNQELRKSQSREYYRRNADIAWAANLQKRFGISPDQYYALIKNQGGLCAACLRTLDDGAVKRRHPVDHDHKTGANRGVVHYHCNLALGFLKDDADLARHLANYLDKFREKLKCA